MEKLNIKVILLMVNSKEIENIFIMMVNTNYKGEWKRKILLFKWKYNV